MPGARLSFAERYCEWSRGHLQSRLQVRESRGVGANSIWGLSRRVGAVNLSLLESRITSGGQDHDMLAGWVRSIWMPGARLSFAEERCEWSSGQLLSHLQVRESRGVGTDGAWDHGCGTAPQNVA